MPRPTRWLVWMFGAVAASCAPLPPEQGITLDDTSLLRSMKDEEDLETRPYTEDERAQSRGKLGGIWVQCYRSFQPTGEAQADLARLTTQCGKPAGLVPVTPVRVGDAQAADAPAERFVFHAAGGHCYRVFAVGAPEVSNLDVTVLDARGKVAASDQSHVRWPVVPQRGPLCLDKEGVYTIEVAVVEGTGSFALQVLGDGS